MFKKLIHASLKLKIIIGVIFVVVAIFVGQKLIGKNGNSVSYQTAIAEKGTLVKSVATSGTVATANSAEVTTEASGVIKNIYVANGEEVKTGQVIAELELDLEGRQRQLQALASYNSAKNSLLSLQSSMLTKWDNYMKIAQNGTYQNSDGSPKTDYRQLPAFMTVSDDWLSTEAAYKNQQNTIAQQALAYQQASPIIYAPISGKLTGLGLQIGSVVTAQSNSSGGSTAQKIASVTTLAVPTISVKLSEIDVPKVAIDNKATITFDAFPGKTYTGTVISIDTVGAVSSGVTTYPTLIKLDVTAPEILTNMSATATIITKVVSDVTIVPSSAVTASNGVSTVQVMKNNKPVAVEVTTGDSNDTQTAISSGINEGDEVVTATINAASTTTTKATTSIFGGTNRNSGTATFRGPGGL